MSGWWAFLALATTTVVSLFNGCIALKVAVRTPIVLRPCALCVEPQPLVLSFLQVPSSKRTLLGSRPVLPVKLRGLSKHWNNPTELLESSKKLLSRLNPRNVTNLTDAEFTVALGGIALSAAVLIRAVKNYRENKREQERVENAIAEYTTARKKYIESGDS